MAVLAQCDPAPQHANNGRAGDPRLECYREDQTVKMGEGNNKGNNPARDKGKLDCAIRRPKPAAYFDVWACSMSWIFSSRPEWRPPEKGVSSQICTICLASASSRMRAPRASTLRLLCSRDICASYSLPTLAARIPGTLLAVMAIPIPEPQTR